MQEFFWQIYDNTRFNLTKEEIVLISVLALAAWLGQKWKDWLPAAYSVLLILHITLFRRAPGYDESIYLYFRFWPDAGLWAGNFLNILLFVPFGITALLWKRHTPHAAGKIILFGALLSVFCESMQYLTHCGCADLNDILFNTLGAAVGGFLGRLFCDGTPRGKHAA